MSLGMRLHDTLSREFCDLSPVDGSTFRFYCCGPTVYGPAHIGNFRTFVLQDVFRRTLEAGGMRTLHVRNITDVDDKTIRGAIQNQVSLSEFTAKWTEQFHADCSALNLLPPDIEPTAVDHIPQQISMIQKLIASNHAYQSDDGSVYFRIGSFESYGKLSRLDTRELSPGAAGRSNADEYTKDSFADFVLWKVRRAEDGDNFWTSPWGEGRPGWHLECSAMIQEYLGNHFDLHSGGVDLIFPHHENEIAQSQCACGGEFANHWFHITHLLVEGGKMSKSLGNLYTLTDLAGKGFDAMTVRYVLIGGHYRKPMNFTLESLTGAQEALLKLAKGAKGLAARAGDGNVLPNADFGVFENAWKSLNDDLNTPGALGGLFTGLKAAADFEGEDAAQALAGMNRVLRALGLVLPVNEHQETAPEQIIEIADKRWAAKAEKDWNSADKLRDQLSELGWIVDDESDGYKLTAK